MVCGKKGDKMPKTIKEMGKRKVAYLKEGTNYFDVFIDINGDGVYDQIRIYKAPSTWRESKKKGMINTGARAKLSLPKVFKEKYVPKKKEVKRKKKKTTAKDIERQREVKKILEEKKPKRKRKKSKK